MQNFLISFLRSVGTGGRGNWSPPPHSLSSWTISWCKSTGWNWQAWFFMDGCAPFTWPREAGANFENKTNVTDLHQFRLFNGAIQEKRGLNVRRFKKFPPAAPICLITRLTLIWEKFSSLNLLTSDTPKTVHSPSKILFSFEWYSFWVDSANIDVDTCTGKYHGLEWRQKYILVHPLLSIFLGSFAAFPPQPATH